MNPEANRIRVPLARFAGLALPVLALFFALAASAADAPKLPQRGPKPDLSEVFFNDPRIRSFQIEIRDEGLASLRRMPRGRPVARRCRTHVGPTCIRWCPLHHGGARGRSPLRGQPCRARSGRLYPGRWPANVPRPGVPRGHRSLPDGAGPSRCGRSSVTPTSITSATTKPRPRRTRSRASSRRTMSSATSSSRTSTSRPVRHATGG